MSNLDLATYSNYALYSAMAVLTLTMLAYAGYLAGLAPTRSESRATRQEADVLVGASVGAEGGPARPGATAAGAETSAPSGISTSTRKLGGVAQSLAWLATGLLAVSAILRGLSVMRWPLGNMFEFAVVACLCVMLAFCVWSTRRDLNWLGIFVVTPVLLVLGVALVWWYTEAAELMPSLQSYWLIIHVSVAVIAMAVFFIGAVTGVLYLMQDRVENTGKVSLLNRFPASRTLERITYGLHIVAFPLWTFTLIAGAIWARQAWASYWNWDPKEVWTFVIWVVYAAYLHARVTSGWSKQKATYIALAGFVCILINYGVVNLFFVSQHSYSGL
ncbi:MAG: c-type cytochrome biogenesis protein CcsB [Actinomycetia bacterium]|nr:c-type cytochrome biogenesis protein CcsB [Actinomycetes bacterium]